LNSTSNSGGKCPSIQEEEEAHKSFFLDEDLQECLFLHHEDHSLITDACSLAMDLAPIKIQELHLNRLEALPLNSTVSFWRHRPKPEVGSTGRNLE
jgi:hypothetical protein